MLLNQGSPSEINVIVCGGGGGGGGGSHRAPTPNRSPAGPPGQGNPLQASPGPVTVTDGGEGNNASPDGGGGGGGGGGAPGGPGGAGGFDRNRGGDTGNGGVSKYDSSKVTLVNAFLNNGNGYGTLDYMSTSQIPSTEKRTTSFSGTNSSTLTISSDYEAAQEVYVVVSFSGATNTPVTSDKVTFNVVPGTGNEMINFEFIDNSSTGVGLENSGSFNLRNGAYTFQTRVGGEYTDDIITFYPPDKDVEVFIDLYGSRGDEWDAPPNTSFLGGTGGKGGYGRLSMTLKQNQEYVITGLSTDVGTPFLYEGGTLVAVVGQGGQTGRYAKGGDGGSFTNSGLSGNGGSGAGDGGASSSTSPISNTGVFGSIVSGFVNSTTVASYGDSIATETDGGRTIACTKGVYWRQQGKAACDNLGSVKYRIPNGTELSGTAEITRGFKSGYDINQTAGVAGDSNSGKGGTGANGGDGAVNGAGGGGGGGYISPVATVVSEQSGENDGYGKVVIRLKT